MQIEVVKSYFSKLLVTLLLLVLASCGAGAGGGASTRHIAQTSPTSSTPVVTGPSINSVINPNNGTYSDGGGELLFQINFSEAVDITGSPRIQLDIGGQTKYATYQSGTGSTGIEFSYSIQGGDVDSDGVSYSSTSIDLNSGTITSSSNSETASLDFSGQVSSLSSVLVDTASGITAPDQVAGVTAAPTTSNTTLSVTWNIPSNNGTAIINYIVQYRILGSSTWITASNPTINTTSISGLVSGSTYEIRIAANNGLIGNFSAISTAEIFNINNLSLALWLDGGDSSSMYTDSSCTTPVSSNGDSVGCITDKAGFGRDFTQTTASRRPTYRTNAINGLPGMEFDGAGDYLVDEDGENYVNGFQAFEFFVVLKSDVTNTDKGILDTEEPDGNDDGITLRYDKAGASGGCSKCMKGGIQRTDGSHVQSESTTNSQSTSAQIIGATWADGGKFEIYINGTLSNSWDNGTISGSIGLATKLILGKGPKDTGTTKGWDGKIVEVVFLNTQTNGTQRTKLINYLKAKWNIP